MAHYHPTPAVVRNRQDQEIGLLLARRRQHLVVVHRDVQVREHQNAEGLARKTSKSQAQTNFHLEPL